LLFPPHARVWTGRLLLLTLVVSALVAPWTFGPVHLQLGTQMLCLLALAYLWNLLAGYANIMVIGQHALVGMGAYAFYGCSVLLEWPLLQSLLGSLVVGLLAGILMLALIFQLRDAYLAVGSWVVAETLMLACTKFDAFGAGSGMGLPLDLVKRLGRNPTDRAIAIYTLVALVTALIAVSVYLLMRSRIGLALGAMRDNEEGAASIGVNTVRARILCFLWAAPLTGLMGALIALQKLRISPASSFSMTDWTIYVLFIVVIGGLGSLEGPILGTLLFFVMREFLQDLGVWYLILLGALAIAVILYEPKGLWGMLRRVLPDDLLPLRHRPPQTKRKPITP